MLVAAIANQPLRVALITLALALSFSPEVAAAVCFQQPFGNPNLADGWGSTMPPRTSPHRGVDYPQASGTAIPAVADGVVRINAYSGCLGNVLVVEHEGGIFSGYAHLVAASPLAVGAVVSRGQTIGQVGNTGTCSFGAHLHLTIADTVEGYSYGTTLDPYAFIEAHRDSGEDCQRGLLLEQSASYATPTHSDVDGDGRADLCARASDGVHCWPASAQGWQASWAPIPWSDADGWDNPVSYATLRMGDVNGDGLADLCARAGSELRCALSTGSGFAADTSWRAGLADDAGWNQAQQFSTLRLADIDGDGKDDLCARDQDGFDCWLSDGTAFASRVPGPRFSDDGGYAKVSVYGTLRMGDLNGDGRADVCIRGPQGMECAVSEGQGFSSVRIGPDWSDAKGWDALRYWSTIAMADVDGDGRADLCARSSTELRCVFSQDEGFAEPITVAELSDASAWDDRSSYATLRWGDIDGDGATDICARGARGMLCWRWRDDGFQQVDGPSWSNDGGWNDEKYFQTIRLADFDGDGRQDLCARGYTGWRCHPSRGDAFGDAQALDNLSDEGGWTAKRYWSTILSAGSAAAGLGPDRPADPDGSDAQPDALGGCSTSGTPATWLAPGLIGLVFALKRRRRADRLRQ